LLTYRHIRQETDPGKARNVEEMPRLLLTIMLVLPWLAAAGEPPLPFQLDYSASYSGLKASSRRNLLILPDGTYRMDSETSLRILGAELSNILETSDFAWSDDRPLPLAYSYVQSGIGGRARSLAFDHDADTVTWHVDERTGTISMETPLYDDLSSFLVLRELLSGGEEDLYFDVVDKNTVKPYHYVVLDRHPLQTALGIFNAVHLERVRVDDSERHTEFWLAEQHEYILLKFLQVEPDKKEIKLDITTAAIDGIPIIPDTGPDGI
jgi:hypothetical protein